MGGDPRVVLVHDYLGQFGGAERVVEELCSLYPESPLFTSYYAPDRTYSSFREIDVHQSFLRCAPGIAAHHKAYLPLYPAAFATMKLPPCDVVISSSSAFAKGVQVPKGARHICYCHAPMRFAWRFDDYVSHEARGIRRARPLLLPLMQAMRRWDVGTNARVDAFIANSENIKRRVATVYDRDAIVVHPPVDVERFEPSDDVDNYYLVLSRLAPYKRVDLAVDACTRLSRRLLVVGEGPARRTLEQTAGPTVEFLGRCHDDEVVALLSHCRALLFCGEEDFGITPIEAMASGRPVIAYGGGGALETVVDGATGTYFGRQDPESVCAAIERFEQMDVDPRECTARAAVFGRAAFRDAISRLVGAAMSGVLPVAGRGL